MQAKQGQSLVTRENLALTLEVTVFIHGRAVNFVLDDVEKTLAQLDMPKGYTINLSGERSDMNDSKAALGGALGIAVFAIYLLLLAQLRSFVHPLTIMVTIPLSLIGVAAALFIAGKPVSMPVMVGMILLAGTVVNNAILLIDFIRQAREKGDDVETALLGSVELRFQPIMMTSLSTVIGMIPLAAEWALGAERFAPLAVAVIGGMSAATLLTMVVIPVLYSLLDDLGGFFKRLLQ